MTPAMARMTPAMAREARTVSRMLDALLHGQIAQAADMGAQRLKSLEMMSHGSRYTVAQEVELLGREVATMSAATEVREAARRARQTGKAKLDATRPYGTKPNPGGRMEENQKGGKKGGGKGKQQKGDGKKGDKPKGDGQQAKN